MTLFTDLSFLPKVPTRANTTRPIFVPSMHKHPDKALRFLCVRRALNEYLHRKGTFRQQGTTHLFVAYGRQDKGKPISQQRLSRWLVECIKCASSKSVQGHHTRKMAVTYANMEGPEPQSICNAATWPNSNTFVRFYQLDAVANYDAEFGRRVLSHSGPSTSAPHRWGRYQIPLVPSVELSRDPILTLPLGSDILGNTNIVPHK